MERVKSDTAFAHVYQTLSHSDRKETIWFLVVVDGELAEKLCKFGIV